MSTSEPEGLGREMSMDDLISRQAAIDAHCELCDMNDKCICMYCKDIERFMKLPTADLSEYCDKLWKTAYERGKEEAHPRKGKWKEVQVVIGRYGDFTTKEYECEICGYRQYFPENYCGRCGTRMEESDG